MAEQVSLEEKGITLLRISRIIEETPGAKTFILESDAGAKLNYRSGQFVTLVFNTRYGEKRRSYSISSSPELNEPLSITVKRIENGEFSRLLHARAKQGDILLCAGINGLFVLPQDISTHEQYWFICAGSGITPCFSLLKTILACSISQVILVFSNKSEEETIFYQQILSLKEKYPQQLVTYFLFSNRYDIHQSRLSNWLLEKILAEYLPVKNIPLFYLCGPFEYMQMVTITLRLHVPAEKIIKENFSTIPRLVTPKPPDTGKHLVSLHFKNKLFNLEVQYPSTILAAAKLANIPLPFSCEAGRCGSCVARCVKGETWMAYNEVLTDRDVEKGLVLLCQAFPVGGDAEIVC